MTVKTADVAGHAQGQAVLRTAPMVAESSPPAPRGAEEPVPDVGVPPQGGRAERRLQRRTRRNWALLGLLVLVGSFAVAFVVLDMIR